MKKQFAKLHFNAIYMSRELTGQEYRLYTLMLYFRNKTTGLAYPSREKLADILGCTPKALDPHIKGLVKKGWLTRERRARTGVTATYRVFMPDDEHPQNRGTEYYKEHPQSVGAEVEDFTEEGTAPAKRDDCTHVLGQEHPRFESTAPSKHRCLTEEEQSKNILITDTPPPPPQGGNVISSENDCEVMDFSDGVIQEKPASEEKTEPPDEWEDLSPMRDLLRRMGLEPSLANRKAMLAINQMGVSRVSDADKIEIIQTLKGR